MSKRNIARRRVLKILGASATIPLVACNDDGTPIPYEPLASGTPSDPDLIAGSVNWDLVLTPAEMVTVTALCDVIIPTDDVSSSASAQDVPEFINEWVSAPYPSQQNDQVVIRGGLVWLNTEANGRFGSPFADLETEQQHAICDDIKFTKTASAEFQAGAAFFRVFRNLTASGFYTTREGMNDLGYVGNQALPKFEGPPPEVLRHLGLDG